MDELIFDSNKTMLLKHYKFKAGWILRISEIVLTSALPLGLPYCTLPMGQIFVVTSVYVCSNM